MHRIHMTALALSAAIAFFVGGWAFFAPQSFYDAFPGVLGQWISTDGPYNEHLVRDVGALNLALAFVAALALVTGSALVARAAGGAALIYGIPHLAYHALNLDGFDGGDAAAMLVSLTFTVAAAVVALWPMRSPDPSPDRSRAAAGGTLEG